MSLFDLLVADAFGGVAVCLILVAHYARRRQQKRIEECDAYDVWAQQLHRWTEPDALVGEVVEHADDELGRWYPAQHAPADAHIFRQIADQFPVNLSWRQSWASHSGAWATVGAR